ncbi:hypothetical protein Q4512_11345 [Oceanihabitans sp. 2_MG-2023]|uniref:hypothetical protein n=1 Tax=Oceanihabitans sp. 2_MG-2023 TaxID=3062661 RepID=UPI0026E245C9|nr:hypothetical protein [Oceanihabitans sp. 2_MG-2023]MDO6597512.1 hypothetical protein [Oceanihabitans sp. 2_MG-2023]
MTKKYDYLLVVIGCIVAIYASAESKQNTLILVVGIVVLMFGLFRISRTIPNKKKEEENENI